MARLPRRQHEQFAQLVARGTPQGEAYASCGYKPSAAHASHLAARPDVKDRIEELRAEASAVVLQEGPRLEALGVNAPWLVQAYQVIKDFAMAGRDFKTANEAVKNMDSVLNFEQKIQAKPEAPQAGKIDVNSLSDKLGHLVDAAKAPEANRADTPAARPAMKALRAAENEI